MVHTALTNTSESGREDAPSLTKVEALAWDRQAAVEEALQDMMGENTGDTTRHVVDMLSDRGFLTDRVCTFLRERAAWFAYEADRGGDWKHLKTREEECRWIEQAIRNGRYREDGRPSWLVNAIPVDNGDA
jgi:hypothetical protein